MTIEHCNKTMSITETVFVEGEKRPEFEDSQCFPSNGKNFMCYTESLDDVITFALDPIRDYIFQIDGLTTRDRDDGDVLKNLISVMNALENNARKRLESWLDCMEQHIGRPGIRRIPHGNSGTIDDLRPETPVAVDFIRHNL